MVKKSMRANSQINATAQTDSALNPTWATAAPVLHNPGALT